MTDTARMIYHIQIEWVEWLYANTLVIENAGPEIDDFPPSGSEVQRAPANVGLPPDQLSHHPTPRSIGCFCGRKFQPSLQISSGSKIQIKVPAPHNPSSGRICSIEKLSLRPSRFNISGKRPSSNRTSSDPGTSRHVKGHHHSTEFTSKVPWHNMSLRVKLLHWWHLADQFSYFLTLKSLLRVQMSGSKRCMRC